MRHLKINGEAFNGVLLSGWTISDRINQTSSLKCGILDVSFSQQKIDVSDIKEGSSIELFNNENKLFSGIIKTLSKSEYAKNVMRLDITASDNKEIANRRIIATSVVGKTAGWIVRNRILPILAEEGVTAGIIEDGFTLIKVNFNYISCSQALNYLQTCTGFNWDINKNKQLIFKAKDAERTSWDLTDKLEYRNFISTRKYEQYRNTQYVLGGKNLTSTQEYEELRPEPDGETTEFYTRFPIATKPVLDIYKNGTWYRVASTNIGEKDVEENKEWYFQYDRNVITQGVGDVLTSGEKIRATYVGKKDVFLAYSNESQIAERAEIEISSGKYERFEKNVSLLSDEEIRQYAKSIIDKYGEIEDKCSFVTEKNGLEVGQIIKVNRPDLGINNEDFLIESISIKPIGTCNLEYTISALDGIALGGWETYFKALVQATKDAINEDENVVFTKDVSDKYNISNSTHLTVNSEQWQRMGDDLLMGDEYMGIIQEANYQVYD